MKNREGFFDDGEKRECTKCKTLYLKTSKTVTLCPSCNTERVKAQAIEKKIWRRARSRASNRGLMFDIDVEDIVLPEVCPILGMPLKENKGKSGAYPDSYSLDRIDNSKGYVKGNIRVVSQLANAMKASADREQLLAFAKHIIKEYENSGKD